MTSAPRHLPTLFRVAIVVLAGLLWILPTTGSAAKQSPTAGIPWMTLLCKTGDAQCQVNCPGLPLPNVLGSSWPIQPVAQVQIWAASSGYIMQVTFIGTTLQTQVFLYGPQQACSFQNFVVE